MNAKLSERSIYERQAWMLLAPFFLFFAVFWLVPLLGGILSSLYSNEIYGKARFVGFEHYANVFRDERFYKALRNTLVYTACSAAVILPLGLFLAHLLRRAFATVRPVLTFALLVPGLTPPAVLALLFLLVFHGRAGVLNQLFVVPLGLPVVNWLRDPDFIMVALVIQAVWRWAGFITFFILAGMESIPATLLEAAWLETNSRWRVFWSVTLPLLRKVLVFCAVYLVVDGVALFAGSYILLGGSGGTSDAGLLLVSYTYQQAFTYQKFGTAAAVSTSVAPMMFLLLWMCFLRQGARRRVGSNGSNDGVSAPA